MLDKFRRHILAFVSSKKEIPILAGLAAGLYPFLHYCNSNFTYIESIQRIFEFLGIFIVVPVLFGLLSLILTSANSPMRGLRKYALAFVNYASFCVLLLISVAGSINNHIGVALAIAFVLTYLFFKHYKKIIVLQFVMSLFVILQLVKDVYGVITYDEGWKNLPDSIDQVSFKKHPNIYFIQPDGYANFSELMNELYHIDNSDFEDYLEERNFKLYRNHRSNYTSTLHSNASVFMMKHHYYNFNRNLGGELRNARHMIVGNNPVHRVLKNNGYRTHLILDSPYFLVNRPENKYDYCNIMVDEIPYFSKGFDLKKDVTADFRFAFEDLPDKNKNFFFIERYLPGHIGLHANSSKGKLEEKKIYQDRLKLANSWLKELVDFINENDPQGIIIIMSDHGGYVGFNYMSEAKTKHTDRDLIYSMFSTSLAIKWPTKDHEMDQHLKTNVNLFRVLFSYLSEDKSYLNYLEENASYGVIKKDAPFGVYELIDENGNVGFKAIKN